MAILTDVNLKKYNTFGIAAVAEYFVDVGSVEELQISLKNVFSDGRVLDISKIVVLGGWSNILFVDKKVKWLVIKNSVLWRKIIFEDKKKIQISVWSGEDWNEFVWWTLENGYAGLENLVEIPGNIGAAPMQNIGAYWVEAGDRIVSVSGVSLDNILDKKEFLLQKFDKQLCEFGYRDSIFKKKFKNRFMITSVTFELDKWSESYEYNMTYRGIADKMKKKIWLMDFGTIIKELRETKLPDWKKIWTAWSYFKNPIVSISQYEELKSNFGNIVGFDTEDNMKKLSAWQLIDMCGLKGFTKNNVWTYQSHALILVNLWWATGKDVADFAQDIQNAVFDQFGVKIEPEVNYV